MQLSFAASYASGIQVVVYLALLQEGPDTSNKNSLFAATLSLLLIFGALVLAFRIYRFTRTGRKQAFENCDSCLRAIRGGLRDDKATADVEMQLPEPAPPSHVAVESEPSMPSVVVVEDDTAQQQSNDRPKKQNKKKSSVHFESADVSAVAEPASEQPALQASAGDLANAQAAAGHEPRRKKSKKQSVAISAQTLPAEQHTETSTSF